MDLPSIIPVNDLLDDDKVVIRAASNVTDRDSCRGIAHEHQPPENGDVPLHAIQARALVNPVAGSENAVARRPVDRA